LIQCADLGLPATRLCFAIWELTLQEACCLSEALDITFNERIMGTYVQVTSIVNSFASLTSGSASLLKSSPEGGDGDGVLCHLEDLRTGSWTTTNIMNNKV